MCLCSSSLDPLLFSSAVHDLFNSFPHFSRWCCCRHHAAIAAAAAAAGTCWRGGRAAGACLVGAAAATAAAVSNSAVVCTVFFPAHPPYAAATISSYFFSVTRSLSALPSVFHPFVPFFCWLPVFFSPFVLQAVIALPVCFPRCCCLMRKPLLTLLHFHVERATGHTSWEQLQPALSVLLSIIKFAFGQVRSSTQQIRLHA